MELYLFDTKRSSAVFLKAFSRGHDTKHFNSSENNRLPGKGAERFNDFSWPTWDGQIPENAAAIFQGLVRGTKEVHDVCISEDIDWYYFDQPYFFSNSYQQSDTGDRWYRICKNNTQKNYLEKSNAAEKRFTNFILKHKDNNKVMDEITPKPWQYDGEHILVIPPSYHTAKWYGIDRLEWQSNIVNKIKQHTKKPVIVRQKFKDNLDWSPDRNEKPLSEDLINCYAMVSFHSMCAVHAVMAGVPSFCSEHSPAYPVSMSLKELDQIEDPLYAGDRQDWVKSLMCAQFTVEEMENSKAFSHLNGENKW
tara:strand:+ start:150 stop:1070 length:921 start_codon:yes stop_codon:yes gene_type:complete